MSSHAGRSGQSGRRALRELRAASTPSKKRSRPPAESPAIRGAKYSFMDGMAAFVGATPTGKTTYRRPYSTIRSRRRVLSKRLRKLPVKRRLRSHLFMLWCSAVLRPSFRDWRLKRFAIGQSVRRQLTTTGDKCCRRAGRTGPVLFPAFHGPCRHADHVREDRPRGVKAVANIENGIRRKSGMRFCLT